jgi:hypothetical protein
VRSALHSTPCMVAQPRAFLRADGAVLDAASPLHTVGAMRSPAPLFVLALAACDAEVVSPAPTDAATSSGADQAVATTAASSTSASSVSTTSGASGADTGAGGAVSATTGGDQGGAPGTGGAGAADGGGGATDERACLDPPDGEVPALRPLPPDPTRFMWQGVQRDFVDVTGTTCTARIALAVSDRASCYAAAGGELRCAGAVYTTDFGSTFVPVGVADVEQIFLSPTFNSATGNALCVKTTGGRARCMGDFNDHGQFGEGGEPASGFEDWGVSDIDALATGTWDQLCARTTRGEVLCAGYGFGTTPQPQPGAAAQSLWVDTFGAAQIDAVGVFRVTSGRAEGRVTAGGFEVALGLEAPTALGCAGQVVDGVVTGFIGGEARACWLDFHGRVTCRVASESDDRLSTVAELEAKPVLALAGSYYADSMCAVRVDGSIACLGANGVGQLGTGDQAYRHEPTEVQPPGSVDVSCR